MSGSAESSNHQPRGATAHDETWHHALRVLANAPRTSLLTLDKRLTWTSAIRKLRRTNDRNKEKEHLWGQVEFRKLIPTVVC